MICKLFLSTCLLLIYSINGSSATVLLENIGKANIEQCEQEAGIPLEQFQKLMQDVNNTADEKVLCMIKCLGTKKGFIQNDGTLDLDNIRAVYGRMKVNEDIEKLMSCLEKIEKIATCQDVIKPIECFKAGGLA